MLKASLLTSLFLGSVVQAAPATQANIDACVQRLSPGTTNSYAVAVACSGAQDPNLVVSCMQQLRTNLGFAMPDAAVACAGVKDLQLLTSCLTKEKAANFVDDESTILCNQK